MKTLALLGALLLLACSVRSKWSPFIIGGNLAKISDWPFIVYLNFHQKNPLWKTCGGALISRNLVLTAAHCIEDIADKPQYVTVGVGRTKRVAKYEAGKNFMVVKIISHPKYVLPRDRKKNEESFDYDIAILKLSRPVQGRNVVIKVPLNTDDVYAKPMENCKVAGWGKTSEFKSSEDMMTANYEVSENLKETAISIADKKHCIALAKSFNITDDRVFGKDFARIICAGDVGPETTSTVCTGDSGSPLVCNDRYGHLFLQGVAVAASPLCKTGSTNVMFSQVSKYQKWIDQVLRRN